MKTPADQAFATATGAPSPRPSRSTLLAITSEAPWPLDTGGRLRTFHLLRALARDYSVRLVTAMPSGDKAAIDALAGQGIEVEAAAVGPRSTAREAARAIRAAALGEPYVLYRRHDRRAVRKILRRLAIHPPDVLYLDHLDSFLYRPLFPGVPCVLDLHNVYSTIASRAALERRPGPIRAYLKRESRLLGRIERLASRSVDVLMTVSDEDARHLTAWDGPRPHVVPNGVDCDAYADLPTGRYSTTPTLLFVGAMSWEPNVRCVRFLAREVLPRLRARCPAARLRIVGRDPTPSVLALGAEPNIEVTGAVPDVRPYLREAALLAVPLETGGGTRLKILEALAAGLPVVSTPVGCEALRVVPDEHIVIAERHQFADAIADLLADPDRAHRLAVRGRALVRDAYDWRIAGEAARDAIAEQVGRNVPGAASP